MVSVLGEGSGVAGTSYSLTCIVILPPGIAQLSPSIQWKRPDMPFTPASVIAVMNRGYLAILQLPSLQSSDAGEYLCQASYSLGGYTSPLVNDSFILDVPISKSKTTTLGFKTFNFNPLPATDPTDSTNTGPLVTTVPTEPVVSEVAVSVRSEGSAVAGSTDYSLVCDITIPSLSDTPPSVTWTLPSHTTQTGSAVASGGQSYVSRLPLTPLTHDDEGDYTCTAEYTENGATYSASDTYHVTVGGE